LLGIHNVAYAFPKVKIATTAVDPELNENCFILPGMGNFGDRYFGTEKDDI
jgi:uridine kinase